MSWRGWKWLLVLLPLLLMAALYLLLGTEPGLRFSLRLAQGQAPGELQVERLEGRWLGPLDLEGLEYRDGDQRYAVRRLAFDWQPAALLRGTLAITRLEVSGVRVHPGAGAAGGGTDETGFEPGFQLPLAVRVEQLAIHDVQVLRGEETLFRLDRLQLAAAGEGGRLQLDELELVLPEGRLQARGEIGLGAEAETDLALNWRARVEPLRSLAGRARLSGGWRRLTLDYAIEEPAPVQLQLTLHQPLGSLRWQARLTLPETGLQRFSADWPELRVGGEVRGEGDLESLQLQAELETDAGAGQLYPLQVSLQARDQGDGWRLEQARLTQADRGGWLELSGRGMYGGNTELQAAWRDLRWPPGEGTAALRSPEGRLSWSGRPADYTFELAGRLEGADIPALGIEAQGSGDMDEMRFVPLTLDLLEGRLQAEGRVRWQPGLQWQARVTATDLDPGAWQEGWPGRLSAQLRLSGETSPQGLRQELHLQQLDGSLRGYPVQGQGRLRMAGDDIQIEDLQLQSGSARLDADGRLGERWQGEWRLRVADLAQVLPQGEGRITATGTLGGARQSPRLTVKLEAGNLGWQALALESLQADLDWQASRDGVWHLDLQAQQLRYGDQALDRLEAGVEGSALDHRVTLQASRADADLALALQGQWQDGNWDGRLDRADVALAPFGSWALAQPAALRIGRDSASLDTACWQQEAARLCLRGAGGMDEGWGTALDLTGYPLQRLTAYLPPGHALEGELEAHWDGRLLPSGRPGSGTLEVRLSPGQIRLGAGVDETIAIGGGVLEARVEPDQARFNLELALAEDDRLTGSGRVTGLAGDTPRLQAELRGEVRALGFVEVFSSELEGVQGQLLLDLQAQGALTRPALSGRLRLREGAVTLPAAGIRLQDLSIGLQADDLERLAIEASARSGEQGRLALEGALQLPANEPWRLTLAARGEQFLALDLPEYRVQVTPDLRLAAIPGRVELEGEVLIPHARLRPRDFSGAVAPSPDVVRVGDSAPPPQPDPWRIFADVSLRLGEDVRFDGFGLRGFLGGHLRLKDEPGRLTTGQGMLEIREGRYKAYGQDLHIETGRLLYTDTPLDNPGLDIRAVRKVDEVTAGIRVGGQLRDPAISLYSSPTMAESEILSYLLLGRPLNQASGAEGATLMQAASAAGLGGGGLLAAQIGERLGFDEVEVGGGDTLEETALMVGKYLSPRLYVQYSVGLLEPISTFRVRYRMSRRWTLQTETGTESGADLLYTLE